MPADKGNIKGAALIEFLTWYEARFGRANTARAIRIGDARFPGHFSFGEPLFGVLASRWYSAEIVHSIIDEVIGVHEKAQLTMMAEDAATAIIERSLRGIYKAIFGLFVSPDRYARHGEKLWRLHYDTGCPVFRMTTRRECVVTYEDWRSHHAFICRMNMATAKPIYSAMGCLNVRYERVHCLSEDGHPCESIIRWQ